MKTKEELLERTEILLELCDIRLGDGKDQIAISGPYGLIRYLEDIKEHFEGPKEEDPEAEDFSPEEHYMGMLEAAQQLIDSGDVGEVLNRMMGSASGGTLDDLLQQLEPAATHTQIEYEHTGKYVPVVVLRFDNGPLILEEEIAGSNIPPDAVVVCRADSELAGVLKSKAKAFRHFEP